MCHFISAREYTFFTNLPMHLSHSPQCTIQNRNVHIPFPTMHHLEKQCARPTLSIFSWSIWFIFQNSSGTIRLVLAKWYNYLYVHSREWPSCFHLKYHRLTCWTSLRKHKVYLYFHHLLDIEMAQAVAILPRGMQYKNSFGDARSQSISRHGIDP